MNNDCETLNSVMKSDDKLITMAFVRSFTNNDPEALNRVMKRVVTL